MQLKFFSTVFCLLHESCSILLLYRCSCSCCCSCCCWCFSAFALCCCRHCCCCRCYCSLAPLRSPACNKLRHLSKVNKVTNSLNIYLQFFGLANNFALHCANYICRYCCCCSCWSRYVTLLTLSAKRVKGKQQQQQQQKNKTPRSRRSCRSYSNATPAWAAWCPQRCSKYHLEIPRAEPDCSWNCVNYGHMPCIA